MREQVLDLDGHVVREVRPLGMNRVHDRHRVADAVEEIGIAERDVAGASGDLAAHVRQHHLNRHDAKPAVVHRHDRAVPAGVLAAATGLRVAHHLRLPADAQGGIAR